MNDLIQHKTIRCITYGCGLAFDRTKFLPVSNRRHIKPKGGLWASPVESQWGWRQWCDDNDFGDLSTEFEFVFSGHALVIDSYEALNVVPWQEPPVWASVLMRMWPDYEAMHDAGADAIYLTERGFEETHLSDPSLYGWDCETVFVMNPDCVKPSVATKASGK